MWPEVARRGEEEKSYLPGVIVCAWLLRRMAGWQGQGILLGYPDYGATVHICLPKGSYYRLVPSVAMSEAVGPFQGWGLVGGHYIIVSAALSPRVYVCVCVSISLYVCLSLSLSLTCDLSCMHY